MSPTMTMREYPAASPLDLVMSAGSPTHDDDDAATIRDKITSYASDGDDEDHHVDMEPLGISAIGAQQWRWSTSTFGNASGGGQPGRLHVPGPRLSHLYSEFGSDEEWSDDDETAAEFQHARYIPQFGRSAFDLAPRSPVPPSVKEEPSAEEPSRNATPSSEEQPAIHTGSITGHSNNSVADINAGSSRPRPRSARPLPTPTALTSDLPPERPLPPPTESSSNVRPARPLPTPTESPSDVRPPRPLPTPTPTPTESPSDVRPTRPLPTPTEPTSELPPTRPLPKRAETTSDLPPRGTSLRTGDAGTSSPSPTVQRGRSMSYTPPNRQPSHPMTMRPNGLTPPPPPPPRSRSRGAPPPLAPVPPVSTQEFTPTTISPIAENAAPPLEVGKFVTYKSSVSLDNSNHRHSTSTLIEVDSVDPEWAAMYSQTDSSTSHTTASLLTPTTPVASMVTRPMSTSTALSAFNKALDAAMYSSDSSEFPSLCRTPSPSRSGTLNSLSNTMRRRKSTSSFNSRGSRTSRSTKDDDFHALPTAETMLEAEQYELWGEDLQPVTFGSLYPTEKKNPSGPAPRLVVFFVRTFFCGPCQDYILASVNKLDLQALDEANVSVIIIANGHKEGIKGYRKAMKCPFPTFTDPSCGLYSVFNFRCGLDIGSIVAPGYKPKYNKNVLPVQLAQGFLRSMVHFPQAFGGGRVTQQGGEVIIGPGYKCEFIHRMTHPRDHMEAADIVRAAGCLNPSKDIRHQSIHVGDLEKPSSRRKQRKRGISNAKASSSQTSSSQTQEEEVASTPFLPEDLIPRRPGSAGGNTIESLLPSVNQAQDMALYRFLAEYLESSERLDRYSTFSAQWPRPTPDDPYCPNGLCELLDFTDYRSASEFKDAVKRQYAAAAADAAGTSKFTTMRSNPRPLPTVEQC